MKPYSNQILAYIEENINADINTLLLKKSPSADFSMKEIVAQIKGRQIARKKFPFLLEYAQYRYPVKLSLEQASSQETAEYKSTFLEGNSLIDLTGGMGIDTYLIGRKFEQVTYVDINEELCQTADFNFNLLGLKNYNILNKSGEAILENDQEYDIIYIDPSRRHQGNRKYDIQDLAPNVVALQDQMLEKSKKVVIKLSPMQDVKSALAYLRNVSEIHYVSLDGEMKEIIFILEKDAELTEKIVLLGKKSQILQLENTIYLEYSDIKSHLYIPDAAVMKSGKQDEVAAIFGLTKMNNNTHIYTSDEVVNNFPGRIFAVRQIMNLNKKTILPHLPHKKANIIAQNHPLRPEDIRKKLGINDGGDDYLIAFTNADQKKVVAICSKL